MEQKTIILGVDYGIEDPRSKQRGMHSLFSSVLLHQGYGYIGFTDRDLDMITFC